MITFHWKISLTLWVFKELSEDLEPLANLKDRKNLSKLPGKKPTDKENIRTDKLLEVGEIKKSARILQCFMEKQTQICK